MPIVSLSDWNRFLFEHPNAHLLQTGDWGELKSAFGWKPVRLITGDVGVQILFRRLPLGFTVGYIPKGPVCKNPAAAVQDQFWQEIENICKTHRAVFCKFELDSWDVEPMSLNSSLSFIPENSIPPRPIVTGPLFKNNWSYSTHNIQPPRTLIVDLKGSVRAVLPGDTTSRRSVTARSSWSSSYRMTPRLNTSAGGRCAASGRVIPASTSSAMQTRTTLIARDPAWAM